MPQISPASSDKPEDSKKPATAAANPLLDSIMANPTKRAEVKAKTPSLLETAGAFSSGAIDAGISTAAIVLRPDAKKGGAASNIVLNLYDVVKDPVRTATGLKDQTVKAYQTVKSGDVLGIAHLSGALAFTVGTAGLGGANTVGRVGARTEALLGAEQAFSRTAVAQTLVRDAGAVLKTVGKESIDDLALAGTKRLPEGLVPKVAETTVKPGTILSTVKPFSETLRSIFSPASESLAARLEHNFGNGRAFASTERATAAKAAVNPIEAAPALKPVGELPHTTPKPVVETPVARVETPVVKVETPVVKVETPVAKPVVAETPVAKPVVAETPVVRAETPVVKVETPVAKPVIVETPAIKLDAGALTQVVERDTLALRSQSRNLTELVEQSGLVKGPTSVSETLTATVKKLDDILENGPRLSSQTARELEAVVKQLERPEFAKFFAENPKAAQVLQDIKGTSTSLTEAATSLEKVALPNATTPLWVQEVTANLSDNLAIKSPVIQGAAEQGLVKVEGLGAKLTESGVKVSDEVAISLQTVERSLKTIVEKGATPQVVDDLTRAMRSVEQNLGKEVLESPAGRNLLEARQSVNSIASAQAERRGIGPIKAEAPAVNPLANPVADIPVSKLDSGIAAQVVERESLALRSQSRNLTEVVEQSGLVNGPTSVSETLTATVRKLDDILDGPKLSSQTTVREVEAVIKQLERPEFAKFFAENPKAAQLLQDIKATSTSLTEAATSLERVSLPNATTPFRVQEITANLSDNLASKGPVSRVAAEQGLIKVEGLGAKLTESGVKISDEVASSLQTVERSLKTIAEKGVTPQVVEDLTRAMRSVEQSLGREVLESPAGKSLLETRQAVNSIVTAQAERSGISQIERSLKVMEDSGINLRRQNGDFAQLLKETAPSAKNSAVVERLNGTVRQIDEVLESSAQPVAKAREIQQLVKQFERPEYHQFFVENPRAARLLEDMKGSTTTIGNSAIKVESSALALERIETVAKFGEQTTVVASQVEKLASSFTAEVKLPNVATELKQIADDLKAIKTGANPDLAMSSVRNRIEVIEASGARNLARELKTTVSELEKGSAAVSRVQRMEASVGAIEREAGKIGTQAEKLSSGLADDLRVAENASVNVGAKPVATVEAKVAENLDFISRQSKNLTNAVDDVQAVTRIKESLAKIDEMGGQALFTGEKAIAYRELKQSVAALDRAAVEAQGLRAFENSTQAIVREADKMVGVTARISENSALRGDAVVTERLANVERAAAEVKAATTFEQQSSALKSLSREIDDPRLQSSLGKSIEGRQVLEELKVGVNNLKQNLEVRALEQATVKIEAQAPVAVKAAQGLEQAVSKEATLSNNVQLKQAVADYTKAAENLTVRSERSAALKQMDQHLAVIEREMQAIKVPSGQVTTELNALKQSHKVVADSVSDASVLAQSVIEKRLPHVENLLSQVGVSTSSTVQRELIRQTAAEIQTLRYLGSDTTAPIALQLEKAQANLVVAANQLEVAAYSKSLIKLAANGDAVAAGKLLFAGLTSDGFRTTFQDFFTVRGHMVPLIGGGGDAGRMMRTLSAGDDIFALNRAAIFNPNVVRALSGATMTLGLGAMAVSGSMRDVLDVRDANREAELHNFSPDNKAEQDTVDKPQAIVKPGDEAKVDTKDPRESNDVIAVSAQAVASRPDVTFSSTGQAIVRTAYSSELRNRATSSSASNLSLSPIIRSVALNKEGAPKPEIGAFGLKLSDPDYEHKKFLMAAYGADHFIGKGAEPTPVELNNLVFLSSQQLNLKTSGVVRTDGNRFEKPARDAFVIAPAMSLSSPMSLLNSGASGRSNGLSPYGNTTAGTLGVNQTVAGARSSSDTKQLFSSLAATASEGGSGRGKVTEGEERTEADVLEQGSTGSSTNNNGANLANNDDDDFDGEAGNGSNNIASQTVVAQSSTAQPNVDPQLAQPRTALPGPPKKRQAPINQAV